MLTTVPGAAKSKADQIWRPHGDEVGYSRCGWLTLMFWLYEMLRQAVRLYDFWGEAREE